MQLKCHPRLYRIIAIICYVLSFIVAEVVDEYESDDEEDEEDEVNALEDEYHFLLMHL